MNRTETTHIDSLLSRLGPRLLQAARLAVLAHLAQAGEPAEEERGADSGSAAPVEGGER